jgi:hypothetical protein
VGTNWSRAGAGQERSLAYAIRDARPDFQIAFAFLPGATPPRGSWVNTQTWVTFETGLEEPVPFNDVVRAIRGEAPTASVASLPDTPAPYRGLAAFGLSDARFFFGRITETAAILQKLDSFPFVAVIGPSGQGKTSLVQAGVAAQIRAGIRPGSSEWPVVVMQPREQPLRALARGLATLVPGVDPLTAADERFRRLDNDPCSLPEIIATSSPPMSRVVLIVDRLEELFTLAHDTEETFKFCRAIESLAEEARHPAWVIATMRADVYDRLSQVPVLATLVASHQHYLQPLNADSLREIVEGPAALVGPVLEKKLTDRLCHDSQKGRHIVLPLLEHALDLLWRKRNGRWLTWAAYDEIEGVAGALRNHADAAIAAFTEGDLEVARRVLSRLVWL